MKPWRWRASEALGVNEPLVGIAGRQSARGVGASIPRLEAAEKALGSAVYTDDLQLPGMLHGALLLSPHPHACILSIDVSRAAAVPGVRAIVTGADTPGHRHGMLIHDETPLARERVRYAGEPIAAVAADDLATARRAAALIEVRYEALPAVFSIDEALAEGAPLVHERAADYTRVTPDIAGRAPNELCCCRMEHGDVDDAFARSVHIIDAVYETGAQSHAYLEPAAAIANVDATGRVTIWSSTQSISRVLANIHQALDIPMARIRAIAPRVGGGFGGKSEPQTQIIAVMLARASGRPVKVVLPREDDMLAMRTRHPSRIRIRSGVDGEGRLLAREVEAWIDGGAYADDSPVIANVILFFCTGPYRIEATRGIAHAVYTNKMRAAAMRGFGNPQISFAVESHMDELAAALGIDPLEMRRRNIIRAGDRWFGGQLVRSSGLEECMSRAAAAARWHERPRGGWLTQGGRRGLGMSLVAHSSALGATAAIVRLLEDGTITLNTGSVDIGQGGDTVMAQMCASALGIEIEAINVAGCDTDASPYNSGTNASRSTHMVGRAIGAATAALLEQMRDRAALMLGCDRARLTPREGGLIGTSDGNLTVSFRDIALFAVNAAIGGGPITASAGISQHEPLDRGHTRCEGMLGLDSIGALTFGAHIVEIEIDDATGRATVVQAWCAHDVGRAINPGAIEGQIHGGFVQGMGYALTEELVWREGVLLNPDFAGYKIPGTLDTPFAIHPIIVEEPDPIHPFGAKGIGEPPLIAAAPAIANAVADATTNRLRRIPITPERLLKAMRAATGKSG